jgi:hypothetical protein
MEMFCIGFLAGVVFSIILIIGGILHADYMDKRERNRDRDSDADNNDPDGKHQCVDRDITPEEIEIVLNDLRVGSSRQEKEVIDYLIEKEGVQE